jgi:hypothetical protein
MLVALAFDKTSFLDIMQEEKRSFTLINWDPQEILCF